MVEQQSYLILRTMQGSARYDQMSDPVLGLHIHVEAEGLAMNANPTFVARMK